ncbi:MAG: hypothetical protein JST66_16910 [Bacteroidetes bacterium]|nr:hypothetical protein [Bacteroidota bacterium]
MERFAICRVEATRPRGFRLLDVHGVPFGEARYVKLFSSDLIGVLEGRELRFTAVGRWGRYYQVHWDGVLVGEVSPANWGGMRIGFRSGGDQQVLELVRRGVFAWGSVLRVAKDIDLLAVEPEFNWKVLANDFTVRVVGRGMTPEQTALLVAITGFAMRWRQARSANAG